MDDDDLRYADEILSYLKKYSTGNTGGIGAAVISRLQYEKLKSDVYFPPIFQLLADEGFITKRPSIGRTEDVELTAKGRKIDSLSSYMQEIKKEKKRAIEKEELEIKYLKVQIWANKNWWMIAGISALIGITLSKLIEHILKLTL